MRGLEHLDIALCKLALLALSDHNGHMIVNLKSAKAHLSRLVETAAQGEEIWLTVRGKPRAKLCPLAQNPVSTDTKAWVHSLSVTRAKYGRQKNPGKSQELWDDLRGE